MPFDWICDSFLNTRYLYDLGGAVLIVRSASSISRNRDVRGVDSRTGVGLIIPSEVGRYRPILASLAVVPPVMLSFQIFGRVVEQTVFPQPRVAPMTLGLMRTRRDPGEPDERDIAIRNAAYFKAYRLLGIYLVLVCLIMWSVFESGSRFTIWLVVFPLLVLVPTLPQAVILWTAPDLPEDSRP